MLVEWFKSEKPVCPEGRCGTPSVILSNKVFCMDVAKQEVLESNELCDSFPG